MMNEEYTTGFQSGANWFYWIAGLSLINSVVVLLLQGQWSFVIGLGITQIFDAVAMATAEETFGEAALTFKFIAFALDVLVALFFVLLGWLAKTRHTWAFVVGMVLYALDGLLFLVVQDWVSIGFHGVALFYIFRGYTTLKELREAEALAVPL